MIIEPPEPLPPENEPPRLAMATEQKERTCVECGSVVVLNYHVKLGCVFCPGCYHAEANE